VRRRGEQCEDRHGRELKRNDPRFSSSEPSARVAIDRRGPEKLERPGQGEKGRKTDCTEREAFLSEEDGQRLGEEAEGKALREIERPENTHFCDWRQRG